MNLSSEPKKVRMTGVVRGLMHETERFQVRSCRQMK